MSLHNYTKHLYIASLAFALSPIALAVAQTNQVETGSLSAESEKNVERILIKARKRDETIIDVPLSVKAFSSKDLEDTGLSELESLANFSPNLDFQNVGNSQPGRFNSVIRFRGMDIAISTPTNQTGGFFVDGINVLGGASSVSFSDIAQVEVIRGPQPVYFGRGTFGGAINYTTITPMADFKGAISSSFSPTFGSNDTNFFIEGAISDNLNARFTTFTRTQGAPFIASDGGELGEERTDGVSLILSYSPTSTFSMKTRIAYSEDDDGAPSSTFVSYSQLGNTGIGTPITVSTSAGEYQTSFRQQWHVGNLPYTPVSSNTSFYDVVVNGQTMYGDPLADGTYSVAELLKNRYGYGSTPSLDRIGLRSDLLTVSTDLFYELSETLTLSGLLGYSKKDTTQIRDVDMTDAKTWILSTYLELESWSAESRITYDNIGDARWMIGVNVSEIDQMGDVDGGWNIFDGYFGGLQYGYGASVLDGVNIKSLGLFGSFDYDLTDWATLVLEGRYQDDSIANTSGFTEATLTDPVKRDFKKFLPRVSLIFKPEDSTSVYLSYAEALLPGSYNTMFDSMNQADAADFLSNNPDVTLETPAEKLKSYEVGLKQSIFDGVAWYSLIAFYQEWTGMKSTGLYTFAGAATGTNYFISPTITGSSTQKGIEFDGRWSVTDNLTMQLAYGYTESVYDDFPSNTFRSTFALPNGVFYQASGSTLPRSPKHSGALGTTWEDQINADWSYSVRADWVYRGKTYTDELNLTTIAGYSLLNLRVGFENNSGLDFSVFCNNCLDKEGWATGRRLTDFGANPNFFNTIGSVVDPIMPRELGVKVGYKF